MQAWKKTDEPTAERPAIPRQRISYAEGSKQLLPMLDWFLHRLQSGDSAVHVLPTAGLRSPGHRHPSPECYLHLGGTNQIRVGRHQLEPREGDVTIVPANTPHDETFRERDGLFAMVVIGFHQGDVVSAHLTIVADGRSEDPFFLRLVVPEHEYLELLMTQAVRAERDGGDHAALRKYGAVQTLLAEVADQVATATLLEQGHPLVSRCRFALLGRLADPDLTVKSLAEELRCHPDTLSRLVRAEHGISLNRFIRRERLQHAAHLLATSEVPVKSVAYSVGFADAGYFSRCFSRDYHCSPLAYRHRRQSSEE